MKQEESAKRQKSSRKKEAPTVAWADVWFDIPLDEPFTYGIPEGVSVVAGCRVRAPVGPRVLTGYVAEVHAELPERAREFTIRQISKVVDDEPVFTPTHVDLAAWMARMYFSNLGECLSMMIPGGKQDSELEIVVGEFPEGGVYELSDEQQAAIAGIRSEKQGLCYVEGMTGSGKTEVFLQLAQSFVAEGKSVIYLVPEIALTGQVLEATVRRFGKLATVLHSGLSPSQRIREWRKIMRGEARVVVGARSAVFAPVRDLGLIVLDEEHEAVYKSQHSPRYHARQVAMRRVADEKALLVMGSATPSLEAVRLMREGRIRRFALTRRLAGGKLPEVRTIDMKGHDSCLSPMLRDEMTATKAAGKQTILFLNRRGFSHFYICRSCGHEETCKHCSTSLTYHKSKQQMICHLCGYRQKPLASCPECGSLDIGYAGFGTEFIEETVRNTFPNWKIARIDADTVTTRGKLEETLSAFRRGEIDVLLGTQMIAKGLNFPGVRLVGMILADAGLHMPDFRASERIFSLITQVGGRAGRYSEDGLVIIQCFQPEAQALALASRNQVEAFRSAELETRRMLNFPPFTRLIRLVFRSANASLCESTAEEIARRIRGAGSRVTRSGAAASPAGPADGGLAGGAGSTGAVASSAGPAPAGGWQAGGAGSAGAAASPAGGRFAPAFEILGPAPAAIRLLQGQERHHILVSGTDFNAMHGAVSAAIRGYKLPGGVRMEIDVDPVHML